jgi:ATP-dependent Clp protease ATP-binding subunit ClpC
MTSNLGGEFINKSKTAIGFVDTTDTKSVEYESMKQSVLNEVKKTFRPEFLNRLDEIVVFHQLTSEHIKQIIQILMRDIRKRLEEKTITIELSEEAKNFLVDKGFDPVYGARPLKRALQRYVEDPLSEELLRGRFNEDDHIVVTIKGEKLSFRKHSKKTEVNAST